MYSEEYYKEKYFKYKNKYLELKNIQVGGTTSNEIILQPTFSELANCKEIINFFSSSKQISDTFDFLNLQILILINKNKDVLLVINTGNK